MIWANRIISFLALAASLSRALSEAKQFKFWAPMIRSPNESTVWHAGVRYNVTWDTSNQPTVTNYESHIYLAVDGLIDTNEPLVSGFDVTDGRVEITVPRVKDGEYQIILMGESSDISQKFKIVQ